MMARTRMRAGSSIAALVMLLAVGAVNAAPTDAAWTEPEYASSGALNAIDLSAAPTITSCTTTTKVVVLVGLVFDTVTITWTSTAPLEMQRVYFGTQLGSLTPTLVSSTNGNHSYSVTYSEGLLESLLGNLLGSTTAIAVRAEGGSWSSPTATNRLRVELLGLNPRCLDPVG